MKIEYHNDGKGKYQSWEAKISHHFTSDNIQGFENSISHLELEAYGATQEEARKAIVKQILNTTMDLLGVIEKL